MLIFDILSYASWIYVILYKYITGYIYIHNFEMNKQEIVFQYMLDKH